VIIYKATHSEPTSAGILVTKWLLKVSTVGSSYVNNVFMIMILDMETSLSLVLKLKSLSEILIKLNKSKYKIKMKITNRTKS